MAGLMGLTASSASALELKDISFKTKGAGTVLFSHSKHLAKKSPRGTPAFSCAVCHEGNKTRKRYTMADMYKGKSCGACHNGKQTFDIHECSTCHQVKEIVYQVKETGPTPFSHALHLKKYTDCSSCHTKLYKTANNPKVSMAEMEKGRSCGACHNGKQAFGIDLCSKCHESPEVTYKAPPAPDAIFSHTFHTSAYNCKDCHTSIVHPDMKANKRSSMADMEMGASCGSCHDGNTAFSVKVDCLKCHKSS
jgi:c(7)-type cytochrome triheme protein